MYPHNRAIIDDACIVEHYELSNFDKLYKNKEYDKIISAAKHADTLSTREVMILQSSCYQLINTDFDINSFDKAFLNTDYYDSISYRCLFDFFCALQDTHNYKWLVDTWEFIKGKIEMDDSILPEIYLMVANSFLKEGDYNNYIFSMQCAIDIADRIDSYASQTLLHSAKYYAKKLYDKLISLGFEEEANKCKEENEKFFGVKKQNLNNIDWSKFSLLKNALDSLLYLIESTSVSYDERKILLDSLANIQFPHNKYPQISNIFFKNQLYNQAIEIYKKELYDIKNGEKYKEYDDQYVICHNIIASYLWQNNPDSARYYLDISEDRLKFILGCEINDYLQFINKRSYFPSWHADIRQLDIKRHIMLKERTYDLLGEFEEANMYGKLYDSISTYDKLISLDRETLISYNTFHEETSAHIGYQLHSESTTLCLRKVLKFYKELYNEILMGYGPGFLGMHVSYSSKEREQKIKAYGIMPNLVYSYLYNMDTENYLALAYDYALFTKGALLNSEKTIYETASDSAKLIIKTINDNKGKLQSLDFAWSRDSIQMIIDIKERLLMKIIDREAVIRRNNVVVSDIISAKTSNQVAIEFVSANRMNAYIKTDTIDYYALVLDSNKKLCKSYLFSESELLPLISTTTESQINNIYKHNGNGSLLAEKIWSKILPYVNQGETICFAPTGLLHQLAIESLPYDEDHTMADVFNLVRLSSTREIVTNKDETHYATATLYGGIQYDMNATEILAASERYNTDDLLASRGIENDTLNRGSVDYLKGSKTEVENINSMLKQNNLQVQLFTSTNANEESFKALSGKHQNILHIATHGFFWTDSTAHEKDYISQRMILLGNDISTPPAIDPLNRCGLLFAGANIALQGHSADLPEGVQDGILTAKEISLLDLRDADLVVLSACETGKGEITSEGVFGLQRAFKMAGAQTIIMSLWPVHDMATQLLMTEFYRNWITNHQSKREAFRNAQNTVRSQYEEPVYWAGFIMLD